MSKPEVMSDIRVIAAIDALKRAVLQVTGKARVKNLVLIIEAQNENDPEVYSGHLMDICNCPTCTRRLRASINSDLDLADAAWKRDQRAAH